MSCLEHNGDARPRQAAWVKASFDAACKVVLHNTRTQSKHQLNETATIIWQLCDGLRSIDELIQLFEKQYPNHSGVRQDLLLQLASLVEQQLVVLDGGIDALEFSGQVVRSIKPSAELLWQLELIRQFLFGCTRIAEADSLNSDLETLLGARALAKAKQLDVDAARTNGDSTITTFKAAMQGESFVNCLNKIIRELQGSVPQIDQKIEIAGHAMYRRGAHMGWHSNHSRSDGRIYCSWAEKGESNFFRYVDPRSGEIVTEWEAPGWNIKSFTIPVNTSRFWHCIGANSLRLSLGFRYSLPVCE